MDSPKQEKAHFVLVPLMAPGHFIPMLDMGILFAQRGLMVTIITTPRIAIRYSPTVHRAVQPGYSIQVLQLKYPAVESGIPEGYETAEDVSTAESAMKFLMGISNMQKPFEELYQSINPIPSCMVADKHIGWLADTARKFNITRIIFDGMSCFTLMCTHCIRVFNVLEGVQGSEPSVVPGLPDKIELRKAQLPSWVVPDSKDGEAFSEMIKTSEAEAYGIVVNSFEELEPKYVEELKKVRGDRVWSIGPLSLRNKDSFDKVKRGNKSSIDESTCLKWLDQHEPGSVVYLCLGSLSRPVLPQLIEIGLGLECSNHPFVWVIRDDKEDIHKWIRDEGFGERTKDRSLIIRGWAPQVLILSHPAVGVFLTHCGWNSALEGLSAGVPMITWPMFAEQFYNEKLLVNVLEIGISLGIEFSVPFCEEERFGVVMKRERITEGVKSAIDGGEEVEMRRSRTRVLAEMAKKSMEEGGSSHLNLTLLIKDVMENVSAAKD